MSFFIGPNLPANVVEIGQEISQTKLDELNAGVIATQAWVVANAGGGVTIPYLQANYQPLSGMSSYLTTASATSTYAPKASPTFTGTVTIPAGASISGYLTSSTAASTYQTISGMVSYLTTASAATTYQLQSGMSSYLTTSSASNTYAPKANPTFTGTVTIPAGASISGYLTTSSASSTYQTISGMSSYAPKNSPVFTGIVDIPAGANIVGYATQSYVTSQGYLTDAPSNGNEYVRKNGAWAIATGGGGGGGISEAPNDGYSYVRQMSGWIQVGANAYDTVTTQQWVNSQGFAYASSIPTLSVTNIDLTGNFNGYSMGSGYYSFKYDSTANTLRIQDGVGFGTTVSTRGIDESVSNISITTTLDATHSNVLYVLTGFYTINIPQDSVYSFPIGKRFFICSPAGSIVDTVMTSVSLNGMIGGNYTLPNGVSTLIKVAADTWYIS